MYDCVGKGVEAVISDSEDLGVTTIKGNRAKQRSSTRQILFSNLTC